MARIGARRSGEEARQRAQLAPYAIAEAALHAPTLRELYAAIHRIIDELMPARNFYIALYDPQADLISFPYFVDEYDAAPPPKRPGRGMTEYVLRTGTPLLGTPEVFEDLVRRREVELIGAPSVDWVGIPLVTDGETIGVLVVQTYTEGLRYTEDDKAILQFVSTQIAMAIQRMRAQEALRESEERLRALERATTEAIVLHADGKILEVNDAFLRLFGYADRREVIGRSVHDFGTPEGRARVERSVRSGREMTYETGGLRKDGSTFIGEVFSSDTSYNGRPVRMTAIRDITGRRQLEAQLQQAQKIEAVGRLAGGVAHDFNNLLTAVLASAEVLRGAVAPDSPYAEDVKTIVAAAQRGAELTQRLLAFSRKQALDLRPTALAPLVTDFMRMARRVVPEDVAVNVESGARDTTVIADAGAIEQILMNLVTNARDAMPEGGTLVIRVGHAALDEQHVAARGWGRVGDFVLLEVRDSGHGMDDDVQRRIFEPFFTTKPVGRGTGLGMSMVYGLMKQHDGFVDVASAPGQGTSVKLYFPVASGATAVSAAPAVATPLRGGTETILLVEDDSAVRSAACRVLERVGYRVVTATNGLDALAVLGRMDRPPDLIISDVVMPQLSGPQLLAKLREAGPVPRFLFTSGHTAPEVLDRAQLDPEVDLLPKPWMVADLLRKVRDVLDRKEGR